MTLFAHARVTSHISESFHRVQKCTCICLKAMHAKKLSTPAGEELTCINLSSKYLQQSTLNSNTEGYIYF